MVAIGSVGCVLVWASQCFAFIRYNKWQVVSEVLVTKNCELMALYRLWKHKRRLKKVPALNKFDRWPRKGFSTYLGSLQPIPAYVGLISCLLVVLVLNSVCMYNGEKLLFKALVIYLGVSTQSCGLFSTTLDLASKSSNDSMISRYFAALNS